MAREPKLTMLPDKDLKLSGGHFRRVVRRIECTVPLAGFAIQTHEEDGGIRIHLNAERITLNVCSNGTPSTIIVLSPAGK